MEVLQKDYGEVKSVLNLHPEVKQAVLEEFKRLTAKFPNLSAEAKMNLATEYVEDVCIANTMLFKAEFITIK